MVSLYRDSSKETYAFLATVSGTDSACDRVKSTRNAEPFRYLTSIKDRVASIPRLKPLYFVEHILLL